MDTAPLVEDEIRDGRKLIQQLVYHGIDVTVGFWIRFRPEEETGLEFCIASKNVDQDGWQAAYRTIHTAVHRIPADCRPWSYVADVGVLQLVGLNDPLVTEVLALRDRQPGRNRFRRPDIAKHSVEELYIYPPVTKTSGLATINVGTAAEPEFIDLEKVPMVTIIRDSAGPSKVELVGGGKPPRALEGDDAQRFIAQFDAIRKQIG